MGAAGGICKTVNATTPINDRYEESKETPTGLVSHGPFDDDVNNRKSVKKLN